MAKDCPYGGKALYTDCLECEDKLCKNKSIACIGIDQSYKRTGISISVDGKIKLISSIDLHKIKTKTEKRHIFLDDIVNNFFEKIKASRKNTLLALAISLCAFVIACIGCIEVGETEYKSGDAGFSQLPLSAAATLSLINGDAGTYDCELTARDEYLRSTDDDELCVTVPALSKRPAPIYHSDITDDPGDWHNAHVAMYYRKECIWTE